MFYKSFTVVLFIFIGNIISGNAIRQHRSSSELKTFSKCFDKLGCVDSNEKWFDSYHRPVNLEPLERHTIRTEFLLMKRSKNDTKEILYDMMTLKPETVSISGYKKDKICLFLIHDFTSNGHTGWVKHAAFVIEQEIEANVISVDWEAGAEPPYDQAIANARVVALEIQAMINMLKAHFSLKEDKVHLIGHGVGAHIAGYVGKNIKGIYRITALDPTGPRFENMPSLVRLDADDAVYVEVLHTEASNSRSQGTRQPMGHSDFYINNADNQPGCNESSSGPIFTDITRSALREGNILAACSHKRSFKYYISAVTTRECKFIGITCSSYEAFVNGTCSDCDSNMCSTFDMCPPPKNMSKYTKFYLHTNGDFPYCMYGYQVNISIERNPNAKKADGYFEFILIDTNNKITFAMGTQFGTTKRTYVPGNTYTLMLYAPPPAVTIMKEAKVRWQAKPGFMVSKKPVYVKYIAIKRIPVMSEMLPVNGMCPETGTEVKDGAYVQFVSCDVALVEEKERIATMTTPLKPNISTTTTTTAATAFAEIGPILTIDISNFTTGPPTPSTTTKKPTIQCLQAGTVKSKGNLTLVGQAATNETKALLAESNGTLAKTGNQGSHESSEGASEEELNESVASPSSETENRTAVKKVTENVTNAPTSINTESSITEEYDEYDDEADYVPETTKHVITNVTHPPVVNINATAVVHMASVTESKKIIKTTEEETEKPIETTIASPKTETEETEQPTQKPAILNFTRLITTMAHETTEEIEDDIRTTYEKLVPEEDEEEENKTEIKISRPPVIITNKIINQTTHREVVTTLRIGTDEIIPVGEDENEDEVKEDINVITARKSTIGKTITEETVAEKTTIIEKSTTQAKTEAEKTTETTTAFLVAEEIKKIEEVQTSAKTISIGNYSIFQENEVIGAVSGSTEETKISYTEVAEELKETTSAKHFISHTETEDEEIGMPKLAKVNGTTIAAEEIQMRPQVEMGKRKNGSIHSMSRTTEEEKETVSKFITVEITSKLGTEIAEKIESSSASLTTILVAEEEKETETEIATAHEEVTVSASTEKKETTVEVPIIEITKTINPETEKQEILGLTPMGTTTEYEETQETEPKIITTLKKIRTSVPIQEEEQTVIEIIHTAQPTKVFHLKASVTTFAYEEAAEIGTEATTIHEKIGDELNSEIELTSTQVEPTEKPEILITTQAQEETEVIVADIKTTHQTILKESEGTEIEVIETELPTKNQERQSPTVLVTTLAYEETTTKHEEITREKEETEVTLPSTELKITQTELPMEKQETLLVTASQFEETEVITKEERRTEVTLPSTERAEETVLVTTSECEEVEVITKEETRTEITLPSTELEVIQTEKQKVLTQIITLTQEETEQTESEIAITPEKISSHIPAEEEKVTEVIISNTRAETEETTKRTKPMQQVTTHETKPLPDEDVTCEETDILGTTPKVPIEPTSMATTSSITTTELPECDDVEE